MNFVELDIYNKEQKNKFKSLLEEYLKEIFNNDISIVINDELVNESFSEIISDLESDYSNWVYLSYKKDVPVGFVIAQIDDIGGKWCLKPGYGLIREIFIDKNHRRKGYGKEMYEFIEKTLKREKVKKLYLTTDTVDGIEFWQGQGYKFTGEICNLNNSGIYEKLI